MIISASTRREAWLSTVGSGDAMMAGIADDVAALLPQVRIEEVS